MAETIVTLPGIGRPLAGHAGVAGLREGPSFDRLVLRIASSAADGTPINRAHVEGSRAVLRLGPDEWLILDRPGATEALANGIAAEAGAKPHACVDVSDRSVALILEGPGAEDVLAAGCPLPLDGARFAIGRATRTLFAKTEIVLWRQTADRFHIEVARSFAPYLAAILSQVIADEAVIRGRPTP